MGGGRWLERLASAAGFLGVVVIMAALGFFLVELKINGTAGLLFVWGAALVLVWVILTPEPFMEMVRGKGLRFGFVNVIMTALLVGILVVLNVFASQHPDAKADLTRLHVHTLDPQTRQLLAQVKDNVYIVAFLANGGQGASSTGDQPVADLLLEYNATNSKVIFSQAVDPVRNPSMAQVFGVTSATQPTIFFMSKCSGGQLTPQNCQTQKVTGSTEAELDAGLLKLIQGGPSKLCFVTGHGEPDVAPAAGATTSGAGNFSGLAGYLRQQNFDVGSVQVVGSVPADCAAVIELLPKHDLLPNEVAALNTYLHGGGHLMVLADAGQTQNLNDLLSGYGLSLSPGVLFESDQSKRIGVDPTSLVIAAKPGHTITNDLAGFNFYSLLTTSVTLDLSKASGYKLTALATTDDTTYLAGAQRADYSSVQADDQKGPHVVAAAAESTTTVHSQHSRIVVMGTSEFVSDDVISQIRTNASLLVYALNWVAEREVSVNIPTTTQTTDQLVMSQGDQRKVLFMLSLILPLIIVAAGAGIWLGRR
ncbi:MAG: Gldg family protein [Candidatus Dormibacteria bacterium]